MLRSGARAICMGLLFRCMWRCLGGGAVGGRSERSTKIHTTVVRYASSDVYCCVYSFAGVFSGVIAFLFYKIVLRSGAIRSYVL